MSKGRIVKALSGFYYVRMDGELLRCRARGKFRKDGLSPLVGDQVEVKVLEDGTGMVWEIEPRRNAFARPAVANIDQMVIIASQAVPQTDPFLIDRICSIAELKHCDVLLVVNKCDLEPPGVLETIYEQVGIPVCCVSAATGEGIDQLADRLVDKLSAFTGNSGVGKSSILNAIDPRFSLSTGEVSEKLGRGRHTTRHVELFSLCCGGEVVDTPGFSSFDGEELNLEWKAALPETFQEFRPYLNGCRFVGCSHTKEKGCAVLQAVKEGKIPASRHSSYLRLYEELKDLKEWQQPNGK